MHITGGYIPKNSIDAWSNGIKEIDKAFKNEVKTCRNEHILYELQNYESFYTGDIESAWDILKEYYTLKQVLKVFNDYKKTPAYTEQY